MLVEFSVQNFRSIYKRVTLSMEAVSKNELDDHVETKANLRLLKTSVIYGANASGKSNLLKAMSFIKDLVLNSSKESHTGEDIRTEPFFLNSQGSSEPTEMEIVFLIDDILYRYGFAVDTKQVQKEWLIMKQNKPKARDVTLFKRDFDNVTVHDRFKEAKVELFSMLRKNTLFISLIAQFNGTISSQIVKSFVDTTVWNVFSYQPGQISILISDIVVPQEWVSALLNKADLGIKSIKIKEQEIDPKNHTQDVLQYTLKRSGGRIKLLSTKIQTEHEFFDADDNTMKSVLFDLDTQESEGTKRFYYLAGVLYNALNIGGVLLIDEIESSLHPILTGIIIKLFQDKVSNANGAQLIFTTHDTNHLDKNCFRRDEIWFTEKDTFNSTDLYSLVEYKMPAGKTRKDASYRKDYIRGKYGAIPYTRYSDFEALFSSKK